MTEIDAIKNAQRLYHIIQAIARIRRSVDGISKEDFFDTFEGQTPKSAIQFAFFGVCPQSFPENQATDALHIAAAAVMGADVLLTWNCKHMANPHTLPKTRQIVTAAGYVCPQVMTPKTFLDNLNMEAENA